VVTEPETLVLNKCQLPQVNGNNGSESATKGSSFGEHTSSRATESPDWPLMTGGDSINPSGTIYTSDTLIGPGFSVDSEPDNDIEVQLKKDLAVMCRRDNPAKVAKFILGQYSFIFLVR
jgi:hypothetical protein